MDQVNAAALDLGSNSFHLVVARVRPDRLLEPIYEDKVMLQLGEVVASRGFLDDDAQRRAAEVAERFAELAHGFGARVIVAAATASFRDAENGQEVAERLGRLIGVPVRILSGHEEAAIIFSAIRSAGSIGEVPVVVADLGGGSLELALGTQRELLRARSLPLGVGKLAVRHPMGDPPDPRDLERIRGVIVTHLAGELDELTGYEPRRLVLASGTFLAIAKVARRLGGYDELADGQVLRVVDLQTLADTIARIPRATRSERRALGIDERRLDGVVYGSLILAELLGRLRVEEVWTSRWALREGLLIEAIDNDDRVAFAFDAQELREGSVRHLMEKYRVDLAHAHAVAAHVEALRTALRGSLGLAPEDEVPLRVAALLHDVGAFVAGRDHDRHGAYLLAANPPRGLSLRERLLVEGIVASHRRGEVRASGSLGREDRRRVAAMAAILRVADALDASHTQPISRLEVTVAPREVQLVAYAPGALGAERHAVRAKAGLLEELLARPVRLSVVTDEAVDTGSTHAGSFAERTVGGEVS